jgi:serine acetyltransferase
MMSNSAAAPAPASIDRRAVVSDDAFVGEGCRLSSGCVIGAGVRLDAHVVVGPNVVFVEPQDGNEPRAAHAHSDVRIGANATIHAGVNLAAGCVVRPGAVVTRSVPPRAIVEGNPAIIVGYVGTEWQGSVVRPLSPKAGAPVEKTPVRGVTFHTFPVIPDLRGSLTVGEFQKDIPFVPKRYFMVFGVPSREVRGEHAHRECHQFLVCVRGTCAVMADDGERRVEVTLDAPHKGIYLPPMTWGVQYKYSPDALLLVFASHPYDAADYIRDYAEFLAASAKAGHERR